MVRSSAPEQVSLDTAKSDGVWPVRVEGVKVMDAAPMLVTVTLCGGLVFPMGKVGKVRLYGESAAVVWRYRTPPPLKPETSRRPSPLKSAATSRRAADPGTRDEKRGLKCPVAITEECVHPVLLNGNVRLAISIKIPYCDCAPDV